MRDLTAELTRAELEVMQVIWDKGDVFLNEIYESFPEGENRPAYSTISTFVRILQKKGYIDYKPFNKAHRYFALVSKEDYTHGFMQNVMRNFFDNSPSHLFSFFADRGKLTAKQYEELKAVAEKIVNENSF